MVLAEFLLQRILNCTFTYILKVIRKTTMTSLHSALYICSMLHTYTVHRNLCFTIWNARRNSRKFCMCIKKKQWNSVKLLNLYNKNTTKISLLSHYYVQSLKKLYWIAKIHQFFLTQRRVCKNTYSSLSDRRGVASLATMQRPQTYSPL